MDAEENKANDEASRYIDMIDTIIDSAREAENYLRNAQIENTRIIDMLVLLKERTLDRLNIVDIAEYELEEKEDVSETSRFRKV